MKNLKDKLRMQVDRQVGAQVRWQVRWQVVNNIQMELNNGKS